MTLYEYKLLNEEEQAEALWNKGVYLDVRYDSEHKILLYQLNSFYIEVFYNPISNGIIRLRSFRSVDQLRPYLEKIDIATLI